MLRTTIAIFFTALAMTGTAYATADGPDYYRVTKVDQGDIVNLRAGANAKAEMIIEIPPDSNCILNLGCHGGLTMDEFTTLSKEEQQKRQKKNPRWCKVEFNAIVGWVAGRFLAEGDCNAAADKESKTGKGPSFDCAKGTGEAEQLVCGNEQLSALDRELARVYKLAVSDQSLTAQEKNSLKASQRGWIKGRDETWKVEAKNNYVTELYVGRIAELLRESPVSRTTDNSRMSSGPALYDCGAIPAEVYFINTEPAKAVIFQDTKAKGYLITTLTPETSGAKYVGYYAYGSAMFWSKGEEAILITPEGKEFQCTQTDK